MSTNISIFTFLKQMHKDTQQAVNFIKANLDFFCAPFLDQKEFQHWTLSSGQERNIRNLTDSLLLPLTNPTSYIAEFIDALIGKALEPKDTYCMRYGDEQRLINLLEKNWSLRRSILMTATNPSIKKWNEDHPLILSKSKKFFTIYEAVKTIEEKIRNLSPQFKEEAECSLASISLIKQELYHLIDAEKSERGEMLHFHNQCSQLIRQAKQDLIQRWGGHHELKHVLFLIGEVTHHIFSNGNPYSFFNEHSKIMESFSQLETTLSNL
ncbi:hypothetical protein [Legionella resiliens]|uniref:Uncharacterized protein n=1 Tax=Legionella resiliens TaxID=2905958 RepID=A0ABS8X390_9GAMM|nr:MULTISPECIES: hypothetical protein [unclassified Legionella]MCE0723043.1 hypothetical protein [Legionella sp. 9fVS26]MCE3532196.1 hypothetical protein [Legionella sp. 8cVS16]